MALPILKSQDQDLMLLQTKWVGQLNPLLSNPVVNGQFLTNVALSTGANSINHLLGRRYQGYLITGMHGVFVQVFDTPSNLPDLTLVLNSSGAGSIDLYVF